MLGSTTLWLSCGAFFFAEIGVLGHLDFFFNGKICYGHRGPMEWPPKTDYESSDCFMVYIFLVAPLLFLLVWECYILYSASHVKGRLCKIWFFNRKLKRNSFSNHANKDKNFRCGEAMNFMLTVVNWISYV